MAKWRFTNIQHEPRVQMGLTPNEYCVLDVIYQSQTHPRYSFDGWARIGCHKIASFLGFSSGTVHKMLERFEGWGFLEFDQTREYKRTTPAWYDVAYIENTEDEASVQLLNSVQKVNRGVQKVNTAVQKVNTKRSKSEPITNKLKETKKETKGAQPRFSPPTLEEIETYLLTAHEENFARREAEKFYDHFSSNGWKVGGRAAMKDWKAAARNWMRRAEQYKPKLYAQDNEQRFGAATHAEIEKALAIRRARREAV